MFHGFIPPFQVQKNSKRIKTNTLLTLEVSDDLLSNQKAHSGEVRALKSRLDTETLKARFDGKDELLKKIYHEFLHYVDTVIPEMKTAYEGMDLQNLTQKAHTLKGNAALIGAGRVSELAFDVQQASSAGDVQLLTSSLPQLFEEVYLALNELERFVSDQCA